MNRSGLNHTYPEIYAVANPVLRGLLDRNISVLLIRPTLIWERRTYTEMDPIRILAFFSRRGL